MDAAEAPVRCDLYQVRPLEAVRHYVVDVLVEVQDVLVVGKVLLAVAVEREVEEGLLKVEAVVVIAVVAAPVWVGAVSLAVTVEITALVLI